MDMSHKGCAHIKQYQLGNEAIDIIDLKCLVVSKGVRVDPAVYERFSDLYQLSTDPRRLSCLVFPDGTVATFTDMEPVLARWGQHHFWTEEEKSPITPVGNAVLSPHCGRSAGTVFP